MDASLSAKDHFLRTTPSIDYFADSRIEPNNVEFHRVVGIYPSDTPIFAGHRDTPYPLRQRRENSTGTRLRGGKNLAKVRSALTGGGLET
jgi:hypothetical protein